MGRKTKPQHALTPEVWRVIVEYVEAGNYVETAAAVAGIPKRVVRQWLELGAQGHPEYGAFHDDVMRAEAVAQSTAVGLLQTAGGAGDTKALMWFLDRRWPAQYGAKVRHIVQQEIDGILDRIEALAGEIGEEAVETVLRAIAGEGGAGAGESDPVEPVH